MDLKICHRLLRKVGRGRLLGDEVQDERGWSSTLIQQNEHWSGASGLHITEIPWISMALKRLVKPFSKINVVWQPKENSRWFKSIWSNITHHPWSNILHLFFIPRLRMVYFFMLSSLLGPHEFLPPDIKQPELKPCLNVDQFIRGPGHGRNRPLMWIADQFLSVLRAWLWLATSCREHAPVRTGRVGCWMQNYLSHLWAMLDKGCL